MLEERIGLIIEQRIPWQSLTAKILAKEILVAIEEAGHTSVTPKTTTIEACLGLYETIQATKEAVKEE